MYVCYVYFNKGQSKTRSENQPDSQHGSTTQALEERKPLSVHLIYVRGQ